MLETFFRIHQFLLEHTQAPVRRALMDEIDWKQRLIGIKGSRVLAKQPSCFSMQKRILVYGIRDACTST